MTMAFVGFEESQEVRQLAESLIDKHLVSATGSRR